MHSISKVCLALEWLSWTASTLFSVAGSEHGTTDGTMSPWCLTFTPDYDEHPYPNGKIKVPSGSSLPNYDVIQRVYEEYFDEHVRNELDCADCSWLNVPEEKNKWKVHTDRIVRVVFKAVVEEGEDLDSPVHCPHPSNCINLSDEEYCGRSPLCQAVKWEDEYLVKKALERGANVNISCGSDTPLLMLSKKWNIIKPLIENGIDVNIKNHDGLNTLLRLVYGGIETQEPKEDIIDFLVKRGMDINTRDDAGRNLLHIWAAGEFRVSKPVGEFLDYLLDGGIDMNGTASDGGTALHITASAINHHSSVLARALSLRGADVNVRNHNRQMPLHIASHKCNIEVMRTLLEAGAELDALDGNGEAPLHITAAIANKCSSDSARALLLQGANANARNRRNQTPLHVAAYKCSNIEVSMMLLEAGAEVDPLGVADGTPFQLALFFCAKMLQLLIEAGANINARFHDNSTSLHIAIGRRNTELTRLLLQAGANVNAKNKQGKTPFLIALDNLDEAMMKLLIGAGAHVNTRQGNDLTPLHLVVEWHASVKYHSMFEHEHGHYYGNPPDCPLPLAELLIKSGASINAQDKSGNTPLHLAIAPRGWRDMVKLLVKYGASVNTKQNKGWTPLHLAVFQHLTEAVKFLLEHGADVNATQDRGWTPWMMAKRLHMTDVVEVLEKNGAQVASRIYNAVRNWLEEVWDFFEPTFIRCFEWFAINPVYGERICDEQVYTKIRNMFDDE